MNIPRDLKNNDTYLTWREKKLHNYPNKIGDLTVKIDKPGQPNTQQIKEIKNICYKTNMAIYEAPEKIIEDKNIALNMGNSIGLKDIERSLTTEEDGVSELSVENSGIKSNYIPYSSKPLGWHTDGCYNDTDHLINGFLLHCVRAAEGGGENFLLDPDIAYILLRDENSEFIDGLMLPDTLTIPPNIKNDIIVRKQQRGPALSFLSQNNMLNYQALHLRYTGRKTHVIWKDDVRTIGALDFLKKTLQGDCPYIFRVKLKPGSGLIGNNILHNRTKFQNGDAEISKRLVYRIYYRDRIANN
tara:strand:- start:30 stop:929 length:900 start_codon:yes stop_codon:yes gene_type:complete